MQKQFIDEICSIQNQTDYNAYRSLYRKNSEVIGKSGNEFLCY